MIDRQTMGEADAIALAVTGCRGLVCVGMPVVLNDPDRHSTVGLVVEVLPARKGETLPRYRVEGALRGTYRLPKVLPTFARRSGRLRGALWLTRRLELRYKDEIGDRLPVASLGPVWERGFDERGAEWWELAGINWRCSFTEDAQFRSRRQVHVPELSQLRGIQDRFLEDLSSYNDAWALKIACESMGDDVAG